jgi:hypothetical protein
VIEISEEAPDAKLSRRQPLDKATAVSVSPAGAVIAPFVTLGLMAFSQVTKNAWCSGKS